MNLKLRKLIALGMAVILASGIAIIPMATSDEETEPLMVEEETKEPEFFTITAEEIPVPISVVTTEENKQIITSSTTITTTTKKKSTTTTKKKIVTTKKKATTTTKAPTTTTIPVTTTTIPVTTTIIETTQPAIPTPSTTVEAKWIYARSVGGYESSCKTYESYRAITSKSSAQYKLLHGGKMIYRQDGMIVDGNGFYAAALGSYFGPIGSKWIFLVEKADGTQYELKIIKADQKQDRHTYNNNRINGSGSKKDIIEFVVDPSKMPKYKNGYVYGGNFNNCSTFNGVIKGWRKAN